jgi:monoamine oxidase
MKRRDFLKFSQLVAASYLLSSSCGKHNASVKADESPDVLIIGAGLAGLAAAQSLMKQGYSVQVLEARDRLGGRTWTSQEWADIPLDLGASWIHGVEGNPLIEITEELETPLVITSYDNAETYGVTGEQLTAAELKTLTDIQAKLEQAIGIAQDKDSDQSLQTLIEDTFDWEEQPLETQQLINFLVNSSIEHEYAGSLDELSTYWFDDNDNYGGEDAIFVEGYQTIVNYLAKDISIKLNQIVETIDCSESIPKVITNQAVFSADHVIITLPLGVLKSDAIEFIPELPEAKGKAIKALGVGVLNKCYLQFSEVFWETNIDWIEQVAEEQGLLTEWVNLFGVTGSPVLLGFNAADKGKEIEAWTDEEIVESAMETLRRLFGDSIPEPIRYQITRWQADPFAQGSYSFNALGSHPKMRDRLAESINDQLFFAGEATERHHFATAHGAYLSGLRAAREINDL